MEHFVAIDNVCAWPNLTLMPDGSIVAAVYNQPVHGRWEGDVACWISRDGGRLWNYLSQPTEHDPGCNRMNHGVGLAANGDLIVMASGWTKRTPPGSTESPPFNDSKVIGPVVCRSSDQGRTWTTAKSLPGAPAGVGELVPFGDILSAADGSLVAGLYAFTTDHKVGHIYVARSRDHGRTWGELTPVVKDRHVEAAMLHMGDGRWLAAARVFGTLELDVFASDDDARSWSLRRNLGIPRVSAAHLLQLADGRIMLSYGNRNFDAMGLDVRYSEDQGRTWQPPRRLTAFPGCDNGYPAAVQLADGTVVIAYYTSRVPTHQRYHMRVVRFMPDA